MTDFFCRSDIVDGQCGIGTIKRITKSKNVAYYPAAINSEEYWITPGGTIVRPFDDNFKHAGGAGFVGTGFVDNDTMKEFYYHVCEKKRLVFQTPVRINKNSGNRFFYALFDDYNNNEEDGYLPTLQPNWPF